MSYFSYITKGGFDFDKENFFPLYREGIKRIETAKFLFRAMSSEEANLWGRAFPVSGKKPSQDLIESLFRSYGYARKWFVFDRPYRFGRQCCNRRDNHRKSGIDTYSGQKFLLIIRLNYSMKQTIKKKLLADCRLGNIPKHIKVRSSRCKREEGTITLGLSKDTLKTIKGRIEIEKLGGRLTPLLNHAQFND